jgi:hypothetical protein
MEAAAKSYESSRRSTRIRAQIPVRVTSLDPEITLSEHCHTVVVNTQGCGVRLSRSLEAGVAVRLDELPTGQVVTAQVANSVPLGADGKYWLVGLAMEQTGNIWGIHPAPADWGSEPKAMAAAAGAGAATAIPAKKDEWPFSQFSNRGEFHPGRK